MPGYKKILVDRGGDAVPLEIKLNQQDGFVRLSGPCHEVFQVRHRLANPNHATISNSYGAPLFTVQHGMHDRQAYTAVLKDGAGLHVVFGGQGRVKVLMDQKDHKRSAEFMFHVDDGGAGINDGEKEMLAAAMALCLMRVPLSTDAPGSLVH